VHINCSILDDAWAAGMRDLLGRTGPQPVRGLSAARAARNRFDEGGESAFTP